MVEYQAVGVLRPHLVLRCIEQGSFAGAPLLGRDAIMTDGTKSSAPKEKVDSLATPLSRYAVIETGGKQYRVSVGDTISVEKLSAEDGASVTFDKVLMVGGEGSAKVGAPLLSGASVDATVDATYKGEKIVIFKYKPKKRYRRRTGHRQQLTRVAITAINA